VGVDVFAKEVEKRTNGRYKMADSTGQRNGLAEHLSRRLEAESLSRPFVQLSRHGVELGL
jgi:hypothetical protein